MSSREVRIAPLAGLGEIEEGDDLGTLLAAAGPSADQIIVISQKAVSKAEGRLRALAEVNPGREAVRIAAETGKDPALVELVLGESRSIIRAVPGVLITETNSGLICANAGIDASNVPAGTVALLPEDPDRSARRIRAALGADGARPGVLIADSFGRPWRIGQADVAIGAAGIVVVEDWRGRPDAGGRDLEATEVAAADQIAAAADLARDKDAGVPGAIVSGLGHLVTVEDGPGASAIQREAADDLFR